MKVLLKTTRDYSGPEEILEKYPCLTKYGLSVEPRYEEDVNYHYNYDTKEMTRIEEIVIRFDMYLDIDTMERLFYLRCDLGEELIVASYDPCTIEIYDGYRE